MAWGSNPETPVSVGIETAGGWSGTPTVQTPIIGASWTNARKAYALPLTGSGALSATLLAKPKVAISFSGAGTLVPGKTQKYTRGIVFGGQDKSGTGLISGFSAWTYLTKPYTASFSGSGQMTGAFPQFDGFRAVVDNSYYPREMPESSDGTFSPALYQKYSTTAAFNGSGNPSYVLLGDNDGLKGILGAAYAYLETSNGLLAANVYALFGIPFVNDGSGTLSFSARMYLLNIATALNGMGTLTAATIARRLTDFVETSDGVLSAVAVGQMVRSVVLSGSGSFSSLARMYSINQAVALFGSGEASFTTLMKMFANSSMNGEGTLSSLARIYLVKIAFDETADGVLSANAFAKMAAAFPLTGSGLLNALAAMYQLRIASALSGSGNISGSFNQIYSRTFAFSGSGSFTNLASMYSINRTYALSGAGAFTNLARMYLINRTFAFSSAGAITATLYSLNKALTLSGAGTLSAARQILNINLLRPYSGNGTLSAAVQSLSRNALYSGAGTFSAARQILNINLLRPYSGNGTLSSTARMYQIGRDLVLSGGGTMTSTRKQIYSITANFGGSGTLAATADFPVFAPVVTTYTTVGSFTFATYQIPYWCKKLDVAVLGGGASGDVGGAGFNNGAGGGQATWQTVTWTRGTSFAWTATSNTNGSLGDGGTGPAAYGTSQAGENTFVQIGAATITSTGGITFNRLASGHGQVGDSAVGVSFSGTSLPGGTGGTGGAGFPYVAAGSAGIYGSGGGGGGGVLVGSTSGGSGSRGYIFIKAYQ
jgi:hypothetical protein